MSSRSNARKDDIRPVPLGIASANVNVLTTQALQLVCTNRGVNCIRKLGDLHIDSIASPYRSVAFLSLFL